MQSGAWPQWRPARREVMNSAEHMEQACQHGWGVGLRQGTEE